MSEEEIANRLNIRRGEVVPPAADLVAGIKKLLDEREGQTIVVKPHRAHSYPGELDKKLEKIVDLMLSKQRLIKAIGQDPFDEARDAIKQAFTDDGWEPPIVYDPAPSERFGEPVDVSETQVLKGGFEPAPRMTGQEWYDKFEKSLDTKKLLAIDPSGNLLVQARSAGATAAKKAAGIE
jgi:hypothetical protein